MRAPPLFVWGYYKLPAVLTQGIGLYSISGGSALSEEGLVSVA